MLLLAHTLAITGHNLDSVRFGEFHHFPELHIVQHQRPDIVTEPVRVQFGRFECDPGLDTIREGCINRLVELQQDFQSKAGSNLAVLQK